MRSTAVLWLCLIVGCIDHSADRFENALRAAPHNLALSKCYDAAVETNQTTGDKQKAADDYKICADEADRKYGRK